MRVLLIEDDTDVAENIWEFFEGRADVVDRAADGLSGLHLAALNPCDLIVLDVGLPGVDGITLARHLRSSAQSRVPVIMLTERDTLDAKLPGFAAGADDCLVKPFALFAEALDRMDERTGAGQPFLLAMFAVSNHRPYKFPQTHVRWDPELGNRGNTARYADWAFGDFIDKVRSHAWFDDTVFVFIADHGHKVNGAAQVPLHRYRIPLLIYSPKHIQPGTVPTRAAQIDLVPTLLGVLEMSYDSSFFGLDLLRVSEDQGRIVVAHNFSVAFARLGHAVVLNRDGTQRGYRFSPGKEVLKPESVNKTLSAQARALTQTAHRMFYNHEYHVSSSSGSERP